MWEKNERISFHSITCEIKWKINIYSFGLAYHPLVKVQQFVKYLMRRVACNVHVQLFWWSSTGTKSPTQLCQHPNFFFTRKPTSQLEAPSLCKHHKHQENIYNNIFAKKVFTGKYLWISSKAWIAVIGYISPPVVLIWLVGGCMIWHLVCSINVTKLSTLWQWMLSRINHFLFSNISTTEES